MIMIENSSLELETRSRLHHLFVSHSSYLNGVAQSLTKDKEQAQELVSDLHLYLLEKPNANIWYSTSYNLHYCRLFLKSRFINKVKKKPHNVSIHDDWNIKDEEYDMEKDDKFQKAWDTLLEEMDSMKREKGWSSIMLFEHYMMSDKTLEEVSKEIGVSISTTYTHVKRAKEALKERINNPFRDN